MLIFLKLGHLWHQSAKFGPLFKQLYGPMKRMKTFASTSEFGWNQMTKPCKIYSVLVGDNLLPFEARKSSVSNLFLLRLWLAPVIAPLLIAEVFNCCQWHSPGSLRKAGLTSGMSSKRAEWIVRINGENKWGKKGFSTALELSLFIVKTFWKQWDVVRKGWLKMMGFGLGNGSSGSWLGEIPYVHGFEYIYIYNCENIQKNNNHHNHHHKKI